MPLSGGFFLGERRQGAAVIDDSARLMPSVFHPGEDARHAAMAGLDEFVELREGGVPPFVAVVGQPPSSKSSTVAWHFSHS